MAIEEGLKMLREVGVSIKRENTKKGGEISIFKALKANTILE